MLSFDILHLFSGPIQFYSDGELNYDLKLQQLLVHGQNSLEFVIHGIMNGSKSKDEDHHKDCQLHVISNPDKPLIWPTSIETDNVTKVPISICSQDCSDNFIRRVKI